MTGDRKTVGVYRRSLTLCRRFPAPWVAAERSAVFFTVLCSMRVILRTRVPLAQVECGGKLLPITIAEFWPTEYLILRSRSLQATAAVR